MNIKELNGRLARWLLRLQMYDFDIKHLAGKNNQDADTISCRPYPLVTAFDIPGMQLKLIHDMQRL